MDRKDYSPANLPRIRGGDGHYGKPYQDYPTNRPPLNDAKAVKINGFEDDVEAVFREMYRLLISKHKDYGAKNIAEAPGGAINGLRVRMHDKLARINNLTDKGINPEHESLEDSFKDMANYAIIGLLYLRGKWDK